MLDVDGSLLRSDLLFETFWAAMGRNIWRTLGLWLSRMRSSARLKHDLLAIAQPEIELLPFRPEIVDMALKAQKAGRPVHLASGADQGLVDALAQYLGLEGEHFGSHPDSNLTRSAKAALLADRFGEGGFDYVGNAWDDLDVWHVARRIIAVAPGPALAARLSTLDKPVEILPDGWSFADLVHELRPLHWLKNVLLFLPLLAAHRLELAPFLSVALAVVAFSLTASSIYIINDLLDLDSDRRHPEKRNRPIASGIVPIRTAMATSAALWVVALALAFLVNPTVAAMTFGYFLATLVYSLWLKHLRWLDILTLAFLFQLRVLTGAVASQTAISPWLLGVVFAVFLSLAVAKRFTGLTRAFRGSRLPGRGYDQSDTQPLRYVAYASVLLATVLFLAYTASAEARMLYSSTGLLALLTLPAMAWLIRMIRLSELGREDYDPVVFVTHDWPGLALASAGVIIVLLAI